MYIVFIFSERREKKRVQQPSSDEPEIFSGSQGIRALDSIGDILYKGHH
jgi:hypothetical protein